MPALTASCCSSPRFSTRPPHSRNSASGQDQAEDRDPLDGLPRVHVLAVAELRARPRVEHVDRDARRVDRRQLEGHLDALLAGLAEVEDSADAGLQARLADGVDRAQASLVADGRGDLVVVAGRRLDVVVDPLDARLAQRPRAVGGDVSDRRAALQVGVLGDQPDALEVLLEVALGQALALRDHAEAVRARRLGGARVLEDLLGLHHRVHRRLRVGEARLRAEAAVLGATARLGVDQRAHVGGVGEALDARFPGPPDERLDLLVVLDLAEPQGLLASDQRRHVREVMERCGRQRLAVRPERGLSVRRRRARTSARPPRRRSSPCSRTSDFQVEKAIA